MLRVSATTISRQVMVMFFSVFLLLACTVTGLFFWMDRGYLGDLQQVLQTEALEKNTLAMQVRFKMQVQEWKDVLLCGKDPLEMQRYWRNFTTDEAQVQQQAGWLRSQLAAGTALELLDQFVAAQQEMGQHYREGLAAFQHSGGDSHVADVLVAGQDRPPTALLTRLMAQIGQEAAGQRSQVESQRQRVEWVLLLLLLLLFSGCAGFYYRFVRVKVATPLESMANIINAMTREKNLARHFEFAESSELMQVANSLNELLISLSQAFSRVGQQVSQMENKARAMSSGESALARSSAVQGEALTQTVAAMEELTTSLHSTTQSAETTQSIAHRSEEASRQGAQRLQAMVQGITAVAEALGSMSDDVQALGAVSSQIESMVSVIKSVADQTNLLALNAAIEAARAGAHGRGFAVVADEVRNLAGRTAQSTTEIQRMTDGISSSVKNVLSRTEQLSQRLADSQTHARAAQEVMQLISLVNTQTLTEVSQLALAVREQSQACQLVSREVEVLAESNEQQEEVLKEAEFLLTLAGNTRQALQEFTVGAGVGEVDLF